MTRVPKRDITGILLLDKPLGLSSNQALQQAKRLFKAAKAGHTGSLDPLATGLLPLCFGQATKISSYLLDADKRYLAQVKLGEKTATGDAEGEIVARSNPVLLTQEHLLQAIPAFIGTIRQIPPMYSALKRDGQPLYKLARAGCEVEREPREVRIHALKLTRFLPGTCEFDVQCSKGTYIRTLVEDIAQAVGQVAHLSGLRRLEVGSFAGTRMWTLDELESLAQSDPLALDGCLVSPVQALNHWPGVRLDPGRAFQLSRGQAVTLAEDLPAGPLTLVSEAGELLGIGEINAQGLLAPKRWMATGPSN